MATADKPKGTGAEGKVPRPDKSSTASKGMAGHEKGHTAGSPELPAELGDTRPPGQTARDALDRRSA